MASKQASDIPVAAEEKLKCPFARTENGGNPYKDLGSLVEKFGKIYKIVSTAELENGEVSKVEKIFVHDEEAVNKMLLDDGKNWKKGPTIAEAVASLVPMHPVCLEEGELHHKLRLAFQQGLNSQTYTRLPQIIESNCQVLKEKLSQEESISNLDELTRGLAIDVIAETVFGSPWNAINDSSKSNAIVHGLSSIMKELNWRVSEVHDKSWKENPTRGDIGTHVAPIAAAFTQLYSENLEMLQKMDVEERSHLKKNVLQHWIAKDVLSDNLNTDEVLNLCLSFLSMGHENLGSVMSWMIIKLAENQKFQDELREEFKAAEDAKPSMMDIKKKFPVFMNVYNEILRLFPSFPGVTRTNVEDTEVLGFKIEKGTEIIIPLYELHRHEKLWGSDKEAFNPHRFNSGKCPVVSTKGFPDAQPLSSGSRYCPAGPLILMLCHGIMKTLVTNFSWKSNASKPVEANLFISLRPGEHSVEFKPL